MVTFKAQMALDTQVFANSTEFAEVFSYLSPAGVTTAGVMVVAARQSFITEYSNHAGLSGTLAIARNTLSNAEIHGKLTGATEVFVIDQIIAIDDDFVTVSALADTRISPQGMR